MTKITKRPKIKIAIIFGLIFVGIASITLSTNSFIIKNELSTKNDKIDIIELKNEDTKKGIKSSSFWNLGTPIEIDDTDPTKNWTYTKDNNAGCNLVDGVYIIENVTIDLGGAANPGIKVSDSNKSFIIQNCTILNANEGIRFLNVNNSIVYDNIIISNNLVGITEQRSYNNTIEKNYIENNGEVGIWIVKGGNNTISDNTIIRHTDEGIFIYGSYNNTIKYNEINETSGITGGVGFMITNIGNNNTVVENTIYLNDYGVLMSQTNGTKFQRNTVFDNTNYGVLLQVSQFCSLLNNNITFNGGEGLWINNLGQTHNNIFMFNNFSGNTVDEIFIDDDNGPALGNVFKYNMISFYWVLDPFYIDDAETGVGAQNWTWAVSWHWISGSGIYSNPYVIKKVLIDGNNIGNCLEIKNSNKSFVIKKSIFYNSGLSISDSGIKLTNVNNGSITTNQIYNNSAGLNLSNSHNATISDNVITNCTEGIKLIDSNNNTITGNTVIENDECGIYMYNSHNNTILNNNDTINNNGLYGLYLEKSNNNTIKGNVINYNTYGIYLNESNWNYIIENYLIGNTIPIFEENCYYNEKTGNIYTVGGNGGVPSGDDDDGRENGQKRPNPIILLIIIIALISVGIIVIALIFKQKAEKGKEVPIIESEMPMIEPDAIVQERFCPYCQALITGDTQTCPYCGIYLNS
ncbi:MAG: hypothetical protein EU548_00540 [Promethearchaeota archaeon]|nr:MAG: hypothetical protein EU548_00540 [Candidatus Lokiarchaeota archaeon]